MTRLPDNYYREDGTRKPYRERRAERMREANPPRAVPMKPDQYLAIRKAQQEGTAAAQEAREAREPKEPNPYRTEIETLTMRPQTAQVKRRLAQYKVWAKQWEERQEAERTEAARLEKVANDPQIQRAVEYIEIALKTAADDDKPAYTRILAIAQEGESKLAWEQLRDLESQVWAREDAKRAELKPTTNAATQQYAEQTERAQASLDRLQTAESEAAKT